MSCMCHFIGIWGIFLRPWFIFLVRHWIISETVSSSSFDFFFISEEPRDNVGSLFVWPWSAVHVTKTLKHFLKEQSTCWQHSVKACKSCTSGRKKDRLSVHMYAGCQHPMSTCFASLWRQTCFSYFQSFFILENVDFSVALFLFSAPWIHLQLETVVLCFYDWRWHITANMMGKYHKIS